MGAMPNDARETIQIETPADVRFVLPPHVATAVRQGAAYNRRTITQEIIFQLEKVYGVNMLGTK